MFRPLMMRHVSLNVLTEDVPLAAQVLAESGLVNLETTDALADVLPEQLGQDFRDLFRNAKGRLDKLLPYMPFSMPQCDIQQTINFTALQHTDDILGKVWQQFSELEEQKRQLIEERISTKQLLDTLAIFSDLDVDLSLLQKDKQFLNIYVGTIPLDNLVQFKESVSLAHHFMDVFHQEEKIVYCVIAGPLEHQEQIDSVLEYAEFHTLSVPSEFKDHPQQVHNNLEHKINDLQNNIDDLTKQQVTLIANHENELRHAYEMLYHASPYATLSDSARKRGGLALIQGWIPRTDLPQLEQTLDEKLTCPFVLNTRKPLPEERKHVPSITRHSPWLKAYKTLVNNYGIPRYGEFDPTILLTFSFILMFGMMFGDVGHGLVIALAGVYWRNKLKAFSIFFIAAGLSSTIFGFLYGSIFGIEETLIPAFWMSPMHNPLLMLELALYWGLGFIFIATVISVWNHWQQEEYAHAVFDSHGIAGVFLYIGGFFAIQEWLSTQVFEVHQQIMILLPLAFILGFKWYENKLPFAERLLVTSIEGFESIINYLANTLSFLRVAAFSLNHVALAVAVFALADMMGETGYWIMVVFGNLFIIILEGAIVSIQILRLEYYEGFSRFFSGDGRAFQPLKVGLQK